jgi:lipid-A-disaccharide synthase
MIHMDKDLELSEFPPPKGGKADVLVIAGEHSGDEQAGRMIRGLLASDPGLRVAAFGGKGMEAAGAQLMYDMTHSSVVGFVEVLKSWSFFKRLFRLILAWIEEYRPGVVCLVDYPGLNLRIAKELYFRGISTKGGGQMKVVYYIAPQVWAWKGHRRYEMARWLDSLAVIFPFEAEVFADTGLPVEFVGHPFLEEGFSNVLRYDPEGPVLLLPGSRKGAVGRIYPAILEGFSKYLEAHPGTRAATLYPNEAMLGILKGLVPGGLPVDFFPAAEGIAARALLTSSGTMSLTCALAGIPGAIAYRANQGTYWMARALVQIPFIGIANLLLGKPMYPEYIQHAATPQALAGELELCQTARRIDRAREDSARLREILGSPSERSPAAWLAGFARDAVL